MSTSNHFDNSFLPPTARGGNLARAHQVANVLLQELVVIVEFVVLRLNSLDPGEDGE